MDNKDKSNNFQKPDTFGMPIIKADLEAIFAGDSYGLFVFNKVEKIVTAVYMLTTLMSDNEPMRNRLRDIANFMLMSALELSERIWGEDAFQKKLSVGLFETRSLFNVALFAKMISPMNHAIMSSELKKLSEFLTNSASNAASAKIAFDPNMFDGNYNFTPENNFPPMFNADHSGFTSFDKGQKDIKDMQNNNTVLNKKPVLKIEKNIKDKDNRQGIILEMLKSGVHLSIKDFAQNIKDVSEKTIQRELITMLEKGLLKKEGERRWSKYFLA